MSFKEICARPLFKLAFRQAFTAIVNGHRDSHSLPRKFWLFATYLRLLYGQDFSFVSQIILNQVSLGVFMFFEKHDETLYYTSILE